jgi:hypothetical protein
MQTRFPFWLTVMDEMSLKMGLVVTSVPGAFFVVESLEDQ